MNNQTNEVKTNTVENVKTINMSTEELSRRKEVAEHYAHIDLNTALNMDQEEFDFWYGEMLHDKAHYRFVTYQENKMAIQLSEHYFSGDLTPSEIVSKYDTFAILDMYHDMKVLLHDVHGPDPDQTPEELSKAEHDYKQIEAAMMALDNINANHFASHLDWVEFIDKYYLFITDEFKHRFLTDYLV